MFLRSSLAALAFMASLPAMAQTAPPSWTGLYGGLNAGRAWGGDATHTGDGGAGSVLIERAFRDVFAGGVFTPGFPAHDQNNIASGNFAGLQLGFNYRLSQRWVGGAEIDFQWADVDGTTSNTAPSIFVGSESTLRSSMALDRFGTARLRLGILATDALLIFGTGGFAFGHVQGSAELSSRVSATQFGGTQINCEAGTPCMVGSTSKFDTGWTAGFGAEWAFTQNLSFKFEYLRVDLGEQNARLNPTIALPAGIAGNPAPGFGNTRFSNEFDVVRIGLNYRLSN
jgi:outer membrane immunogenic protein